MVHFLQVFVVDIRLGQQYIHVARHSASHRMNGVLDRRTAFFDQGPQVANGMLSLSHGHAVTRHKNNALGAVQDHGDVFS